MSPDILQRAICSKRMLDMGKNKKKKQKTVYIDDGSTIANMSFLGSSKLPPIEGARPNASLKEQFKTYTEAVRMMFLPMCAVLGLLALAFLIVYILL